MTVRYSAYRAVKQCGMAKLASLATWAEVGRTMSEGYALNGCATTRAGFIFLAISGKRLFEESGFTIDVDIQIVK